ncbi:LPS biosynthesis protein [Pusillimonas sp. T2]|nr:LPS-assembly protein LptD [Pusillimonas sp. T2]OXR49277.1 LPS biosynthesis protein [Pusillimonas sp. T2]
MTSVSAAQASGRDATMPVPKLTITEIPAEAQPQLAESSQLRVHGGLKDDDKTSFIVADQVETDPDGKLTLTGKAQVRRIDSVVKGDRIDYQRNTGQVDVWGDGMMMRDGNIIRGPELHYNFDSDTGEITTPDFWLGAGGGSGTAERAQIFSRSQMRLTDMTYAACPCPDPAWYISAPRVDFDTEENEGVARNGVLYFKGVPILASPYLSFPLRKERKSGFLIPSYGGSSNSGYEFALPYYFNLAPNYDLTVTPRYMSKRGVQWGADFRYLGQSYTGQLAGSYLANDKETQNKRWMYSWQHTQTFGHGFYASADINAVSDDNYFRDFSTIGINQASIDYLPRILTVGWAGSPYWSATVQHYTYQTLQDTTGGAAYRTPPYNKEPELNIVGARYNWNGLDMVSSNYVTRFVLPRYDGGGYAGYVDGQRLGPDGTRFKSYNTVALPIVRSGWYVTPKVGVHLSQYNTEWYTPSQYGATGYSSYPRTQSRVVPIMSLDSGMTFERDASFFGKAAVQTLEPRLYYLRVPYRDQSSIPVYDTGVATFNFGQAFDENYFSGGWDRIADANQLTLGLTSRWLDANSGVERLSLSVAQRRYFADRQVTLPGGKPRVDQKSDYLVGVYAALTDKLNVRFDAQFNPESNERNRMTAGLRWHPKRLATLSATYRYERDPEQISNPNGFNIPGYIDRSKENLVVSTQWPLTQKIYAMGRVDYSIQEKRSTQTIMGLEYKGDCCWAARVVFQRYSVSLGDKNTALFLQLELTGLGSLGTDPLNFLGRNIPGYEPVTPPIPNKTTFERYE